MQNKNTGFISDFVTISQHIIDWLLKRGAIRSAQEERYLSKIQSTCLELVQMEDPLCDKARFLHENIKIIYEQASQRLPKSLIDHEGWDLFRGLSSARIYYWLRIIDAADTNDEIAHLLEQRQAFTASSYDALLSMLNNYSKDNYKGAMEKLKQHCLNDIARIQEIRPFF